MAVFANRNNGQLKSPSVFAGFSRLPHMDSTYAKKKKIHCGEDGGNFMEEHTNF